MTTEPEQEEIGGVWVRTVPHLLAPRHYEPVLEVGEDFSIVLTPELAVAYTNSLMTAIVSAQYQAGVIAQLRAIGADDQAITAMLMALRTCNERVQAVEQIPLSFEGRVTLAGHPFLVVRQPGRPDGQWNVPDAQSHATGILEVLHVAPLDTLYLSLLMEQVGVDADVASNVVEKLAEHIPR